MADDNKGFSMERRLYYSTRTGKNPHASNLDLSMLCRLFRELYVDFSRRYYFQEAFGYECVDAGSVPGKLGIDIEARIFLVFRKEGLWPIHKECLKYSEENLFDIIEFLYDNVSKPIEGFYHDYSGCGWHYEKFNHAEGAKEFRDAINGLISDYKDGFELSEKGEILTKPFAGFEELLEERPQTHDPINIDNRLNLAISKFRRYQSSQEERRDAIRDLVDILEFLRPQLKEVLLPKDESELFNIANNFGIRHHNNQQKVNYDKSIWYSWMFYYYLATIHTALKLIKIKVNENGQAT